MASDKNDHNSSSIRKLFKVFDENEDHIPKDHQKRRSSQSSEESPDAISDLSDDIPRKATYRYSETLEDHLLSKVPKNSLLENRESVVSQVSVILASDEFTDEETVSESQHSILNLPPKSALAKPKTSEGEATTKKRSTFDHKEIKHKKTAIAQPRDSRDDDEDAGENKIRFEDVDQYIEESKPKSYRGMRIEYGRSPKLCDKFMPFEEYSKMFVDDLIDEALSKGRDIREQTFLKVVEGIAYKDDDNSLSTTSVATYVCVIEWPTIGNFNIDIGMNKIEDFLSYWKFKEDWKHCVNFLNGESDAASDFYHYEAIFSIPCKQYPIPQVTASVYFTFEVSRIRPKSCLVDLHYWFEGQREKHKPGLFTFQEAKLFHIVDAKIRFYKTLTF